MRLGLGLGLFSTLSSFSPTNISGIEIWLRADLGITLSGGDVQSWADQSGTGDSNKNVTNSTSGERPLYNTTDAAYNNKPTISFTRANNDHLYGGTWSVAPSTVGTSFFVGNFANVGVEIAYCMTDGAGGIGELYLNGTDDLHYYQGTDAGVSVEPTPATKHIYCVERNGASTKVYQDGFLPIKTISAGSTALTTCIIGGNSTAGSSNGIGGKVAEFISYNRILSTTERIRVMRYLASRYAIEVEFATTPASISGCLIWCEGDTGYSSGTWTDVSGNGNHFTQSTSGKRPVLTNDGSGQYNTLPFLTFDGTDDQLVSPSLTYGPFTVVMLNRVTTNQTKYLYYRINGSSYEYSWTTTADSMAVRRSATGLLSGQDVGSFWATSATPRTMVQRYGGTHARHTMRLNGVNQTLSNAADNTGDPGTATVSAALQLSGDNAGTTCVAMTVGAFGIFDSLLSDSDVTKIESYINTKYANY